MTKWKLPEGRAPITYYKERYEAAVRDAEEAEAYAEALEAKLYDAVIAEDANTMTETQAAAARRLRRKLEILKLDASKSRGALFHDIHECIALLDIINPDA
jgi:tRNA A37 N6-isopentenylltransferase MiaA